MTDIFQTGEIATIHKFTTSDVQVLETKLEKNCRNYPIALIIPALKRDFFSEANDNILKVLGKIHYLEEVIYPIDDFQSQQEFQAARNKIKHINNVKMTLIWNDGPRIQSLYKTLNDNGLYTGTQGKGRTAWFACGYALSKASFRSIVLHDSDVVTYDREFLARLCLPLTTSHFDYEFCKGYYSRYKDKLYGRVTRLFVFPLIEALLKSVGPVHFLQYLAAFRYPLAGEFALSTRLAKTIRIPSDWGLEIGTMAEIFRKCSPRRICQIELCGRYDHKHQVLSPEDKNKGLHKMSIDIARSLFTNLATFGVNIEGHLKTIRASYLRNAQDMILKYAADSYINNLMFDRHQEELTVETFCSGLEDASEIFLDNPLGATQIPNWSRVYAAIPDFQETIVDAVEKDNNDKIN